MSQERRVGYREIADTLRSGIDSGDFPAGSRIPGENELMSRFGVEQPTARRALDVLKNEGLVYARRGSGTYVREFRPIRRVSPDRLRSEVWNSGRPIWSTDGDRRQVVADVTTSRETPPAHITDVLGLSEDRPAWVRRRRFLIDGEPVQLASSYYPADLVDGSKITEPDTGPGGSYARLRDLGHEPVRFREELRSRMPDSAEVAALELTPGTPVIVIVRTAYTSEGKAVEVNEMTLDAGAYIVEYQFSATD